MIERLSEVKGNSCDRLPGHRLALSYGLALLIGSTFHASRARAAASRKEFARALATLAPGVAPSSLGLAGLRGLQEPSRCLGRYDRPAWSAYTYGPRRPYPKVRRSLVFRPVIRTRVSQSTRVSGVTSNL